MKAAWALTTDQWSAEADLGHEMRILQLTGTEDTNLLVHGQLLGLPTRESPSRKS